ncbi:MAG: hypothetical protein K2O45_17420 [Oscillospiraceae bacterium]|nr:hypothetical protein [Oscillospiraceae bacterium]
MKNSPYFKSVRLWVQGLLLLSLRWAELKTGFDPDTGLSRHSVPGILLAAAILFCAAAELYLCFGIPGGKRTYLNCLEPMGRSHLLPMAAGSLLLCAGAALLLPGGGVLTAAMLAAAAATAAGLILFVKLLREGAAPKAFPLLPAMIFSVLFLLAVYLPEESNPVLARYYLPVLAASLAACAFYQLAGLTCREGSLRWFVFWGDLAVPLCLASMADCTESLGQVLIYFSLALVLTQFLLTRRTEVLPEPEKAPADAADEAEPAQD